MKSFYWALDVCKVAIAVGGLTSHIAIEILSILCMLDESNLNSESLERLEGLFTTNLSESNESYYHEFLYSLSWLYFQGREFAKAIELLRRARIAFEKSIKTSDVIDKDKAFKIDDITCWNASTLLKSEFFFRMEIIR